MPIVGTAVAKKPAADGSGVGHQPSDSSNSRGWGSSGHRPESARSRTLRRMATSGDTTCSSRYGGVRTLTKRVVQSRVGDALLPRFAVVCGGECQPDLATRGGRVVSCTARRRPTASGWTWTSGRLSRSRMKGQARWRSCGLSALTPHWTIRTSGCAMVGATARVHRARSETAFGRGDSPLRGAAPGNVGTQCPHCPGAVAG